MSKRAELNVSVWFFLESVCCWGHPGPGPNAVWIRGCSVSARGTSVTQSAPPARLGLGENCFTEYLWKCKYASQSPSCSPLAGEKGSLSQKGGSRAMAAAWQWAESITSPGAPWWLQLLPGTARSLTHLQSLSKYFLLSAQTHIAYLWIQFASEISSYF